MKLKSFILFIISFISISLLFAYSIYDENHLSYIVIIPSLVLGFIISVIIHELGHLVTGLLTGYKFTSFKVFFIKIYKSDKLRIEFEEGFFMMPGQCLMKPTNRKYVLYNLGGLIFSYLLSIILVISIYSISNSYLKQIIYSVVIINTFLAILNSIYSSDGINDICNLIRCRENKDYLEAILYQLDIVSNISINNKFKSKYKPSDDCGNTIANISVYRFKYYKAYSEKNIEKMEHYYLLIKRKYNNIKLFMLKIPSLILLLNHEFMIKKDVKLVKSRVNRIRRKDLDKLKKLKQEYKLISFYKNNVIMCNDLKSDFFDEFICEHPIDLFDKLNNKTYQTINSIYNAYVRNGYILN